MKYCESFDRYVDKEMSSGEQERFHGHLSACVACRTAETDWQQVHDVMEETHPACEAVPPTPQQVSQFLERAVRAGWNPPESPLNSNLWHRWPLVAAAASILVCLGIGSMYWLERPDDGAQPSQALAAVPSPQPSPTQRVANTPDNGNHPLKPGLSHLESTAVWVDQGSSVSFTSEPPGGVSLRLDGGTVAVKTANGPRQTIPVLAGPYTIRDIGTVFSVYYRSEEGLGVTVSKGVVEVSGFGDLPIRVSGGQTLIVKKKKAYMTLEDASPGNLRLLREVFVPGKMQADSSRPDSSSPSKDLRKKGRENGRLVKENLKKWRRMVISGQYAEAETGITRYLFHTPTDARAWSLLADCRRKSRNWHGALEAYSKVTQNGNNQQSGRAMFLAGEIYQDHLKNHPSALKTFDALLSTNQSDKMKAATIIRAAKSKIAVGRGQEAKVALQEIIDGPYDETTKSRATVLLNVVR